MQTLILFLYRIRAFLLFIVLEVVCLWLVFSTQPYQRSAYFNSANQWVGSVMEASSTVEEYLSLREQNTLLAQENARMREALTQFSKLEEQQMYNSLSREGTQPGDTVPFIGLPPPAYTFIPAKVINQSIRNQQNYLTLDRGAADGLEVDMGVIHASGVVGKIKAVSRHYATVTSILHTEVLSSARINRNNALGSVRWEGQDPSEARLLYIPRHINVQKGDTVSTTGFSGIYPEGTPIGLVKSVGTGSDATYLDIKLELLTTFNQLIWVEVVNTLERAEVDSLEKVTYPSNE
jgi:rod shape-determining protein MreC